MFTIFAKHFVEGTFYEDMEFDQVAEVIRKWKDGEDITVQGRKIPNRYIEAVRIVKKEEQPPKKLF